MILALQSLSPEQRRQLPPHVEIYEDNGGGEISESVLELRKALVQAGFVVPKPQTSPLAAQGSPLTLPEVRYLRLGLPAPPLPAGAAAPSRIPPVPPAEAAQLLSILVARGFTTARIDEYPPYASDDDRQFYGEESLDRHFEIWFPAPVSPAAPSTPLPTPAPN